MLLNTFKMELKIYHLCIYNHNMTFELLLSRVNFVNGLAWSVRPEDTMNLDPKSYLTSHWLAFSNETERITPLKSSRVDEFLEFSFFLFYQNEKPYLQSRYLPYFTVIKPQLQYNIYLLLPYIYTTYISRTLSPCCIFNKLTSVFLCVCPVIDHEFRHNIVKVAVDPGGDSQVDPQTTLTML